MTQLLYHRHYQLQSLLYHCSSSCLPELKHVWPPAACAVFLFFFCRLVHTIDTNQVLSAWADWTFCRPAVAEITATGCSAERRRGEVGEQRAGCIGEGVFVVSASNSKCVSAKACWFLRGFLPRNRHEDMPDTDNGAYKWYNHRPAQLVYGWMVSESRRQRLAVM